MKTMSTKQCLERFWYKLLEQGITIQELDILRLIALGFSNNQIADKLNLSVHTVQTHKKYVGKNQK